MRVGSYYPERTFKTVLVNKPMWASLLLTFLKNVLSPADQKNMANKVLSSEMSMPLFPHFDSESSSFLKPKPWL